MHTRVATSRCGFTLVEAIATMTILAVLSISASRIIFAAADAYASDAVRAELTLDLSAAMERIVAEVRSAPGRETSPDTPWIDLASVDAFAFGGDRAIRLDGESLRLSVDGGPERTLLDHVSGFTVACFDEADLPLALPLSGSGGDAIRRVEFTITRTRHGVSETLRTRVFLRCAMGGGGA